MGGEPLRRSGSFRAVFKTNLLEDDGEEIPFHDGKFEVDLGTFQVCTYRLVLA